MAVYAAHLTRTLQGAPSVFDVTAQEALGATVKPAVRKLFEYLAAVYPNKCGWCERWYDELFLALDYSLQYHFLKHYAASFSEGFYELLRVPISPSTEFSTGQRLPETLERGSLALLVLVPYLKDKIEKYVDQWRDDLEDGRLGKSKADKARIAAVKIYTIVHFSIETAKLLVLARYLTGKSEAPTLALHLLGLTLKNAPPEELDGDTWSDLARNVFARRLGSMCVSSSMVWYVVRHTLQYSAFAVQLLRWWQARAPLALSTLPPPPPPQKDERSDTVMNKCPVCLQPWKVPAVLPVSGYVFCYGCGARTLRQTSCCPVSGLPATDADLVRLYLDL